MQSLRNKMNELHCFTKANECDILVLTETWLTKEETEYFDVEVFKGVHSCRDGRAGGVSIYLKNHLNLNKQYFVLFRSIIL